MGKLEELYAVTEQLVHELDQIREVNLDRDALIERVNGLVQQRDIMIQKLQQPYSEEELVIGRKIVKMNEQIKQQMNQLYEMIKADMKQVQKKKNQNYSYLKPYGNLKTSDGMYMDNKL